MQELPPSLNQLLINFRGSRILLSAVEIDLFSALKGGATSAQAARRTKATVRGVTILLDALVSMGLVRKRAGQYFNTKATAEFLTEGCKNDWRLGIGHHEALWQSWSNLTQVVRKGRPATRKGVRSKAQTESFIGLMEQTGSIRAPRVARAIPLRGIERVLDIGGGSAAYSRALVQKKPSLKVTLLDLPDVIPIARRHVRRVGMVENFTFQPGDLNRSDLGYGFDLVLISNICHMLSPAGNIALIRKSFRALTSGGKLAVHDFILNDQRIWPGSAAIFAVNMLVNTDEGNSFTEQEYRTWMKRAGFRSFQFRRLSKGSDLLLGMK